MAVNVIDPALAGTPTQNFTNNETTKPLLMGATAAVETVAALFTTADTDFPTGVCLEQTGGSSSAARYIYKTITAATTFTIQYFWKVTANPDRDTTFIHFGTGSGRILQVYIDPSRVLRFQNSALGTVLTTSAFTAGVVYRTEISVTMGASTTTATVNIATYTATGTSPIAGSTYTGTGNYNAGTTAGVSQIRMGPCASTGTSADQMRVGVVRYDPTTATFIGPYATPPTTTKTENDHIFEVIGTSSPTGADSSVAYSAFDTTPDRTTVEIDPGVWLVTKESTSAAYQYLVTSSPSGQTALVTGTIPAIGGTADSNYVFVKVFDAGTDTWNDT